MNFYTWLFRSFLYRAFLKYRVWAWQTALKLPPLAIFVWGSIPLLWFALFQFLWLIPYFGYLYLFGSLADDGIYVAQGIFLIAVAPIVFRAMADGLAGFFPAGDLMIGNPIKARQRLEAALNDYQEWQEQYVRH